MAMHRQYGQDMTGRKPVVTFYAEEGNFTRNENMLTDQGNARGGSFASQLYEGDEVQVYVSTDVDMTVAVLSTGLAIGRVKYITGDIPKATATSGTFVRRIASVEVDGFIEKVQLVHDNQAIQAGDFLAVASGHKDVYNKEEDSGSQPTSLIALQHADASSGKYIKVLRRIAQSANEAD